MRQRLGIGSPSAYTLATNGRRMRDFDNQANAMPTSNAYAVLELGGNDLCRPSVGEMTSVASYRAEFRAGLAALRARNSETLLFVASVPDVYNLWFLRGALSSVNQYVADQTGQESQARFYWDNPLIDIIPCSSLLESPTSTAAGDEARRQQVRQRNKEFNQVLAEECALDLRCRFDANALFDTTSNRVSPPDGALLPRGQWGFEDNDISHNFGFWSFLCPAPGILDGGTVCGDHFHPSLSGQAKLAAGGHAASFDFADGSFGPSAPITRAQLVRLLYRLAGSPDVSALPGHGLVDVPAWVEDAVQWARAEEVVDGFADSTFRPDVPVNRGQFANSVFHQST